MCVFVCVSVLFLHFFCKLDTGQGTYCTLFSLPRLCLAQHNKVGQISSPPTPPYLTFFVSNADGTNNKVCSEESDCFSSVPTKARAALLNSIETEQNWLDHKLRTLKRKKEKKKKKGCQTFASHSNSKLLFLVQTSSCNFILESLWIPGTSILRYSIFRLNYESKLYQYVKILYVQVNCSMLLLSALGCVRPPFAGWLCRQVLLVAMQAPRFISCTCWSLMT